MGNRAKKRRAGKKKTPRQPRSDDDLRRASWHLGYELWMLESIAHAMTTGRIEITALRNALIESFAVHARALIHFFFEEPGDPEDVSPDGFVAPSSWVRPPKPSVLRKAKKRANGEIAHLSYDRLQVHPDKKPWEPEPILAEIRAVADRFLRQTPDDRLTPELCQLRKLGMQTALAPSGSLKGLLVTQTSSLETFSTSGNPEQAGGRSLII